MRINKFYGTVLSISTIVGATTLALHFNKSSEPVSVLAASWQNSFCEINQKAAECLDQHPNYPNKTDATRADFKNFSLHGLWPTSYDNEERNNFIFCNTRKIPSKTDWKYIKPIELSKQTRAELNNVMPGSQSHLDRWEWEKHGTCHPTTEHGGAEEYYLDSLYLMSQLNQSKVQQFFEENIGHNVSVDDIRASFDVAFGEGAGQRVQVKCNDEYGLITEIRLRLQGKIINNKTTLKELLHAAQPYTDEDQQCQSGYIDEPGFKYPDQPIAIEP